MADHSTIEWTQATWNPTTGCDRVSPGCDNCYALTLAKRLKGMGQAKYQRDGDPRTSGPGFGLTAHPDALGLPLTWRAPRRVFVNSMSDLFHADVPDSFIAAVFAVMALAPRHTFQVLTKRHARMRSLLSSKAFLPLVRDGITATADARGITRGAPVWPLRNVWVGVSVEDQRWAEVRVPALLRTPAAVRWISAEPLLGPVDLTSLLAPNGALCDVLAGEARTPAGEIYAAAPSSLDWVVAGGESGPGYRPLNLDWVRSLRDQCTAAGVPFLLKQIGGRTPKAGGRELDGREWNGYPA